MIQLSVENINRNTHLILETIQISQVSQDICEFFCIRKQENPNWSLNVSKYAKIAGLGDILFAYIKKKLYLCTLKREYGRNGKRDSTI